MSAVRARFPWAALPEQLADFAWRWPTAVADARGRHFAAADGGGRLWLPLVHPPAQPGEAIAAYAARVPDRIGRSAVVLLQAGAVALAYADEDDLLEHKADKKYVVRGHGKAQPLHRRTRGKSRYGSRLRLQNWTALRVQANERLQAWWLCHGAPAQVFVGVAVRTWPELFQVEPPPPFGQRDPGLRRIPLHVHVPDFAELQRVWRWLRHGRLELDG